MLSWCDSCLCLLAAAAATAAACSCGYCVWLRQLLTAVGVVTVIGVGVAIRLLWRCPPSRPPPPTGNALVVGATLRQLRRHLPTHTQVAISSSLPPPPALAAPNAIQLSECGLDQLLWLLVQRLVSEFFSSWYDRLSFQPDVQAERVRLQLWHALLRLQSRLAAVDTVEFIGKTVVAQLRVHFQMARIGRDFGGVGDNIDALVASCPVSGEAEEQLLLDLAEILLSIALPADMLASTLVVGLLREIIACRILRPLVNHLCEPHFINTRLLQYLRGVQLWKTLHARTYSYAANYEDFIRVIRLSDDLDELKHIRYSIVAEIVQASAINNLKRSRGIKLTRDTRPQGVSKGDLLQARNLKRYINQLNYAKTQCEKRMRGMGCDEECVSESAVPHVFGDTALANRRVLPFGVILESEYTRRYFRRHLTTEQQQQQHKHSKDQHCRKPTQLLEFWCRVNELRACGTRQAAHAMGSEIYRTFLAGRRGVIRLDRSILKRIEGFLVGNRSADVFFELQMDVQQCLENSQYHKFLISPLYNRMMVDAEEAGIDFINATVAADSVAGSVVTDGEPAAERPWIRTSSLSRSGAKPSPGVDGSNLTDHSSFASLKLDQLSDKIAAKRRALQTLTSAESGDSQQRQKRHLSAELSALCEERAEWSAHLERTDLWSAHLGDWCVEVHSAEVLPDKDIPVFVLVVYLVSDDHQQCAANDVEQAVDASSQATTCRSSIDCDTVDEPLSSQPQQQNGWIVIRHLSELRQLHARLCRLAPWLKNAVEGPPTPPSSKLLFGRSSCDHSYLERAKTRVQRYLSAVLCEPTLARCEPMYTFFSPSAGRLMFPRCDTDAGRLLTGGGRRLGLLAALRSAARSASGSGSSIGSGVGVSADVDDDTDSEQEADCHLSSASQEQDFCSAIAEDLAEPLYALISEVFELSDNWLRKTLMTFVQLAYGQTINRRLADIISSFFSHHQLTAYLSQLLASWWPDLLIADSSPSSEPLIHPTASLGFTVPADHSSEISEQQREEVRDESKRLLLESLPEVLVQILGVQTAQLGAVRVFDTLQNAALNKSLVYSCVELFLERLLAQDLAYKSRK